MNEAAKLVFGGPVGVGKTTAIRSMCDHEPISTDVPLTDAAYGSKTTTTVALDFASVKLEDGTPLLVYGLPGQSQFEFMRPILLRGAIGVVILLNATDPQIDSACEHWIRSIQRIDDQLAMVVGITHAEHADKFYLDSVREMIRRCGVVVPVFTIDARQKAQIDHLIRALLLVAS